MPFVSQYLRSWLNGGQPTPRPSAGIVGAAQSDIGKIRTVNEDAVVFCRPERGGALAVVADGMGGEQGGSVASGIASRVIERSYLASRAQPSEALRAALELASREIYRSARRDKSLAGMGATCVALALDPPFAWAAWAGDSRLYLLRNGQIFQMTEDHSVVQEMVRQGLLTMEEASRHEERNVVTRALGSQRDVEVAVWKEAFPVRVADRLLLCSDGLHDLLSSAEILEIAGSGAVDAASSRLIEEANSRGGYDNVSAILLELVEEVNS
jgi:protein phosphatase